MGGKNLTMLAALVWAITVALPTFANAVDYRENLENAPGLNIAQIKDLQGALISVGCPDIGAQDGVWGPSSSSQFVAFLGKTSQNAAYSPKLTVPVIIEMLFKPYYQGRI